MKNLWLSFLVIFLSVQQAFSITAVKLQAEKLYALIRCPSCDFQSISESEALIAQDLRTYILESLESGNSQEKIIEFLIDRYGAAIYMDPFMSWESILLWILPLFLFFALLIWYSLTRKLAIRKLK